jgi:hypothetical protein
MLLVATHWNTLTDSIETEYADELQEKLDELEGEDDREGELLDADENFDHLDDTGDDDDDA